MAFPDVNFSIGGVSEALDGEGASTEQGQIEQRSIQEQAVINQLIIIKHLEIITDNVINEEDLV